MCIINRIRDMIVAVIFSLICVLLALAIPLEVTIFGWPESNEPSVLHVIRTAIAGRDER